MKSSSLNSNPADKDSLTDRTISGFKWTSFFSIFHTIVRFVVLSVLAHLLFPRDFGLISIALIFTSFAERVGQIGVGPALVQLKEISQTHIKVAATLSLILGLCMYALLVLLSPTIADFFREQELIQILKVIGFVFIFEGLSIVPQSLLQRELRLKEYMLADTATYFIGYVIIGISLALLDSGYWSLVYAMLSARLIKMVYLFYLIPPAFTHKLPLKETKELLTLGAGFSLGRLLTYAALQGDNFIVGRILGASMLGMYTRAYQLMTLPAVCFGQVLEKVLFPAMAKRQNDPAVLKNVYLTSVEAIALISLPATTFMYFAAEEIVLVLFGAKWIEVIPALKILSLGIFFRTAYKSADTLIRSLGKVYRHASRQFVYVVVVVIGAYIGTRWGLEGAATAILFAVALNYFLMSALASNNLNISYKEFFLAHLPGIWLSLPPAFFMPFVMNYLRATGLNPFFRLSIFAVILSIVSLAILFSARNCLRPNRSWNIIEKKIRRT